ncbi:hypothetical protein QTJ16_004018 [Diplocarpon rosae]|uniref:Uncharacterized protein n=1 Tax=Diplocarpon rosae TaxID=946125 RepID=A0AAD9SYF7_9HELO|nr:hypothetical protein QTJ16_004018 [Diplocarpon rosae]
MQTVPSLVASSTVGIAAAGLVLGRPERSSPPRPSSRKRKASDLAGVATHDSSVVSSPPTRLSTSTPQNDSDPKLPHSPDESSSTRPPALSQNPTNTNTRAEMQIHNRGRRLSIFRHEEAQPHSEEETRRESVSSRGSWMRRLSTKPSSRNDSPRSSFGPESPSTNLAYGSAAPALPSPASCPAQFSPNKLVKATPSGRATSGPVSRRGSRSQVPTLRRPATSHQRTVTLQQQFRDDSVTVKESAQPSPTTGVHVTLSSNKNSIPESRHAWRLYFESRPTKLSKEGVSGWSSDGGMSNSYSTSRRIILDDNLRPTLVKPGVIVLSKDSATIYYDESSEVDDYEVDDAGERPLPSIETSEEPQKRARRSLSMHFSSPSSWISRYGSLRDNRRGAYDRSGDKRYSSAPVSTLPGRKISTAHGATTSRQPPTMDAIVFQGQPMSLSEEASPSDPFASNFPGRSRNSSSPLRPLSRLSSFNVDLARLGLSASSSVPRRSQQASVKHTNTKSTSVSPTGHASPASTSIMSSGNSRAPPSSELTDRASTLIGSDNDTRGFTSGDDDEIDFQSETFYDSLRSGATGSVRSHNPPLDSMFDESPPSLNGHVKGKKLSIHEMLANGGFQEGYNKIVEEDEETSTPVEGGKSLQEDNLPTPIRASTAGSNDRTFPSSPPSFCLATKDFGRLSLDDEDEDEDWTRDDENLDISNSLSPPSSSLNSRRVSPSFRAALADLTQTGSTIANSGPAIERPKSNLFDWSEPSTDKVDLTGGSPRPKTAHVNQMVDGRGGRAVGRRGPSVLHIRSQSVPVVPDVASQRDYPNMTPKFGTWGLGAKGVSEDWDGDFEFESNEAEDTYDMGVKMENSGMLVPPAIQASQASVVGHVGQIREVCLLVEDLKRLRLLAKEKDLLSGPSATLWKEAEGIIALAVPDEEDTDLLPSHAPVPATLDQDVSDDDYHDSGPDAEDLSISDAPFDVLNRHGQPTGLTYDGNTVRRRSVFSPEDDIFGAGLMNSPPTRDNLRPPSTSPRHSSMKSSSDVARSVMETMHQHRSTSDPLLQNLASHSSNKMPFDTTSLRDLVHRASVLSRTLADLIRKVEGHSHSPEASPKRDSSPAFTRVFTDPSVSPPKHLFRSHSNNSILSASLDGSPTRSLGSRMHMMTVV